MTEPVFIPLAPLISTLGIMLVLAVIVERFLAVLNWLIDRLWIIKSSLEYDYIKEKEADLELEIRAKEEEDYLNTSADDTPVADVDLREIEPKQGYWDSRFDIKSFPSRDPVKVSREFWSQIVGSLIAIAICFYMKFSVWVLVLQPRKPELDWWEFVLTGIIIGAGAKPVHFLMNFLLSRKINITREEAKKSAIQSPETQDSLPVSSAAASPAIIGFAVGTSNIEEIVGFEYNGGDRPQRLETTHLRKKPLDLIVYHHTAMHSDSPFSEVIREFDRKGWLTGYHCVIMPDGVINTLCRWDRIGNHARDHNNHSISVALHGNFEPNPEVPFSNFDGRFGILIPTQPQVDAAARIVAFWTLLCAIDLEFPEEGDPGPPRGIVPHKHLSSKACPGANFPYKGFQKRVVQYAERWKADDTFTTALKTFKDTPMVPKGGKDG